MDINRGFKNINCSYLRCLFKKWGLAFPLLFPFVVHAGELVRTRGTNGRSPGFYSRANNAIGATCENDFIQQRSEGYQTGTFGMNSPLKACSGGASLRFDPKAEKPSVFLENLQNDPRFTSAFKLLEKNSCIIQIRTENNIEESQEVSLQKNIGVMERASSLSRLQTSAQQMLEDLSWSSSMVDEPGSHQVARLNCALYPFAEQQCKTSKSSICSPDEAKKSLDLLTATTEANYSYLQSLDQEINKISSIMGNSTEETKRLSELKSIRENILAASPWLEGSKFKEIIQRKGGVAAAFKAQMRVNNAAVLSHLNDMNQVANCIIGTGASQCDKYDQVMTLADPISGQIKSSDSDSRTGIYIKTYLKRVDCLQGQGSTKAALNDIYQETATSLALTALPGGMVAAARLPAIARAFTQGAKVANSAGNFWKATALGKAVLKGSRFLPIEKAAAFGISGFDLTSLGVDSVQTLTQCESEVQRLTKKPMSIAVSPMSCQQKGLHFEQVAAYQNCLLESMLNVALNLKIPKRLVKGQEAARIAEKNPAPTVKSSGPKSSNLVETRKGRFTEAERKIIKENSEITDPKVRIAKAKAALREFYNQSGKEVSEADLDKMAKSVLDAHNSYPSEKGVYQLSAADIKKATATMMKGGITDRAARKKMFDLGLAGNPEQSVVGEREFSRLLGGDVKGGGGSATSNLFLELQNKQKKLSEIQAQGGSLVEQSRLSEEIEEIQEKIRKSKEDSLAQEGRETFAQLLDKKYEPSQESSLSKGQSNSQPIDPHRAAEIENQSKEAARLSKEGSSDFDGLISGRPMSGKSKSGPSPGNKGVQGGNHEVALTENVMMVKRSDGTIQGFKVDPRDLAKIRPKEAELDQIAQSLVNEGKAKPGLDAQLKAQDTPRGRTLANEIRALEQPYLPLGKEDVALGKAILKGVPSSATRISPTQQEEINRFKRSVETKTGFMNEQDSKLYQDVQALEVRVESNRKNSHSRALGEYQSFQRQGGSPTRGDLRKSPLFGENPRDVETWSELATNLKNDPQHPLNASERALVRKLSEKTPNPETDRYGARVIQEAKILQRIQDHDR